MFKRLYNTLNARLVILLAFLTCGLCVSVNAQNNTNSPYTRFGYGELAMPLPGQNRDMGGTAIGSRERTGINSANPASYTAIDSLSFLYDFGVMGKLSTFTNEADAQDHDFNGNIEFLALRFPIGRWFAASAGITPFSYVGYDFPSSGTLTTTTTGGGTADVSYTRSYKGEGGINKLYGGLAFKVGKHLSLGTNFYYLFGDITHTRQVTYDATYGTFYSTLQNIRLHISDFNMTYGVQLYTPIRKQHYLTIGATLELKNTLHGKYAIETSTLDTVTWKNSSSFQSPLAIGVGVNYKYRNKLMLAADYRFENWSDCKYFNVSDTLKNRQTFAIGAQVVPDAFSRHFYNRMSYRFGVRVSDGYLDIKGGGLNNYGITFGLGIPTRGGKSSIDIGAEYGHIGNNNYQQIRETYWKFSVSASFSEMWFFKRQFH